MRKINTRFFFILVTASVLFIGAIVGVHRLQAGNIAGALLWQAEEAEKANKPALAVRYLGQYLEFAPDDLDRRAHLATLLSDAKLAANPKARGRARFVIEQVLARDPQRHELRQVLCRLALESQQLELAKEHLDYLEKTREGTADVAFLSGQYHEAQNQPQPAAASYRRTLQADPGKVEATVRLTALLRRLDFGKEPRHGAEIARLIGSALEKAPTNPGVLNLAAQLAQEKGDTQAALGYLKSGLEQSPGEPQLYQALARVQTQNNQRTEAIETLRRGLGAVAKDSSFELNWALANVLLDADRLDEARKVMTQMREVNPLSSDYVEARCLMQQGRWFDAAKMLERLRPAFKTTKELAVQVDLFLGACYQKLDEPTQQLAAFRRAIEADPTSLLARHGLANAQWALGDIREALTQFEGISKVNPNRAEAARWRIEYARMLLQSSSTRSPRELAHVERELDEAERELPLSVDSALMRAELCFIRKQEGKAEAILRSAAAASADRHEPWISLASLAMGKGDATRAEAILQEAKKKLGDTAEFRLAQLQFQIEYRRDDAPTALAALEQDLKRFSLKEQSRLLDALGEAHIQLGKLGEAERLLKQLSKLAHHTEDVRVRMRLFNLALAQGNDAEMQRVLGEVKTIEGDSPAESSHGEARRLLWRAKSGQKEGLEEARALLTKAATHRPDWHAVSLTRGEIDQLQGRTEQAIAHYRKAIDLGNREPLVARQLVALLSQAQRFEEAEQEIRKMTQQFGLSADLERLAVAISYNRKDYARAAQLARASVRSDSTNYREHLWVGQVMAARGQASDEAEKAFRLAVSLGEQQPEAWLGLVRYLVSTGQMPKANQEIARAGEKLDESQRPLVLAQCHEMLGAVPVALEHYQDALRKQPRSVLVHRAAADFFVRIGKLQGAETSYRMVMDRRLDKVAEEDVVAARQGLALAIARSGNSKRLPEALALVNLTLEENGQVGGKLASANDEQLAQARVLATFSHHGLRSKAIAILEALHQKLTLQADDQYLLGKLLHQHGSDLATWKKTQGVLKGLTTTYPNNPRYLGYYANLVLLRKEIAEADPLIARLEQIEKDRKVGTGTFGSVELKARALELRGRPQQAIAVLEAYVEQEESPAARTFLLAGLHGRLGNFQEVVALCDKARQAGRRDEAFSVAVGIMRAGKTDGSDKALSERWQQSVTRLEQDLRAALQKDEENVALRLQLADLVELQGKSAEVEAICRQVLAQEPANLVALNNLSWLLAHKPGKADEALELINRALDKYGSRPELLDTRAVVYLNQGQHDRSVRELEKVVQEAPTPARLFHLSRAHQQARNHTSAVAALQRANEMGLSVQQLHPSEQEAFQRVIAELQKR